MTSGLELSCAADMSGVPPLESLSSIFAPAARRALVTSRF